MTKEQIEQLEEFAFELKNNRDYYSRAKIIEMMVDEVKKLNKPAVSVELPELCSQCFRRNINNDKVCKCGKTFKGN